MRQLRLAALLLVIVFDGRLSVHNQSGSIYFHVFWSDDHEQLPGHLGGRRK
jgi:hypothetical protein